MINFDIPATVTTLANVLGGAAAMKLVDLYLGRAKRRADVHALDTATEIALAAAVQKEYATLVKSLTDDMNRRAEGYEKEIATQKADCERQIGRLAMRVAELEAHEVPHAPRPKRRTDGAGSGT